MDNPLRFTGLELYFDDLPAARHFYVNVLGLRMQEDQPDHHVQLDLGDKFLCLEGKGLENYRSADKAVVFFQVPDLIHVLAHVPDSHVLRVDREASAPWAAVRDPEGHTVLLIEAAA